MLRSWTLQVTGAVLVATTICGRATAVQKEKQADKSLKISVTVRGAHCDRCVNVLRDALGKVKGIKFAREKLAPGEKPNRYSAPLVVTILDREKTHVGALAETVGKARTPHRDEFPPGVNLVLYTKQSITEDAVVTLRDALRKVNGVEVREDVRGGVGGSIRNRFYWIKLENAGGAALADILQAAKQADPSVELLKRNDRQQ